MKSSFTLIAAVAASLIATTGYSQPPGAYPQPAPVYQNGYPAYQNAYPAPGQQVYQEKYPVTDETGVYEDQVL